MNLGLIYDIRCKVIGCLVRYVPIITTAMYEHLTVEGERPGGLAFLVITKETLDILIHV